jgi:hypothetical protein
MAVILLLPDKSYRKVLTLAEIGGRSCTWDRVWVRF